VRADMCRPLERCRRPVHYTPRHSKHVSTSRPDRSGRVYYNPNANLDCQLCNKYQNPAHIAVRSPPTLGTESQLTGLSAGHTMPATLALMGENRGDIKTHQRNLCARNELSQPASNGSTSGPISPACSTAMAALGTNYTISKLTWRRHSRSACSHSRAGATVRRMSTSTMLQTREVAISDNRAR